MAEEQKQRAKRIFINKLDSYSSKHIGQYLSTCSAGGSSEEPKLEEWFQIVGTVTKNDEKRKRFALEEYTALKRDKLLEYLMECDVVVYNISEDARSIDEATWAVSALHSVLEHFQFPKMFILVSTLMTWAKTKPSIPDSPEIPLTEEDYTRKQPHPHFREHASAEKLVLKLGKTEKSKLRTYVISTGLQYGMEEGIFHFFFKACWLGEMSRIPIPEPSTNIIPTIHVNDLASIVQNVIDLKPKIHYIIAVDDSHNTLEEIVKAITFVLGPGEVQKVSNDSVQLTKRLTRSDLACLNINLFMETALLKNRLNVSWVCESGLVENIFQVVEEYRKARGLLPLKICIHGPPAVGKSSVAARLCKHYKLHYVGVKEAVEEKIKHLEKILQQSEANNSDQDNLQETQKQLRTLKDIVSQNQAQSEDQNILRIIRNKLHSKSCRNQGFVLDNFPCTHKQANKLFHDEEKVQENPRSNLLPHDESIMPEYIISLEATDEFLKERVRNLPQSVAEDLHYTQDEFLQRLLVFRAANSEEDTVLDYFLELEIHTEFIEIDQMIDPENENVIKKITEVVGEPRNYGPMPEEKEKQEKKKVLERQQRLQHEAIEYVLREAEEESRMTVLLEEWNRNRMEVKKQEKELQEARSIPFRHYLIKYVVPSVKEGLVACCQVKPDDPVDFLAEYLSRNNTED